MNRHSAFSRRAAIVVLMISVPSLSFTQSPATPRASDGHPDLTGYWVSNGGLNLDVRPDADGDVALTLPARDNDIGNFEKDFAVLERSHTNKPLYKPEYWDQVQDMDWNGLTRDPVFRCLPAGVPRMGPPHKIVQTPTEIVFLYESRFNGQAMYRLIPTDGRDHHPLQVADTTWLGYSIGRWENDTMIIDTVGFNDESWLAWTGYPHTWDMKVTERIYRVGDTLHWEATVDDPMLIEPWTLDPMTRVLNSDPDHFFFGAVPCDERDAENIVDPNVRG